MRSGCKSGTNEEEVGGTLKSVMIASEGSIDATCQSVRTAPFLFDEGISLAIFSIDAAHRAANPVVLITIAMSYSPFDDLKSFVNAVERDFFIMRRVITDPLDCHQVVRHSCGIWSPLLDTFMELKSWSLFTPELGLRHPKIVEQSLNHATQRISGG